MCACVHGDVSKAATGKRRRAATVYSIHAVFGIQTALGIHTCMSHDQHDRSWALTFSDEGVSVGCGDISAHSHKVPRS